MILQPILLPISEDTTLSGPERVRRQREYARKALAICAERSGVSEREWAKDDDGVPQPSAGYHWSISHKPRWVAAVVSDRSVGVDVEQITPRRTELFAEIAQPEEWAAVGGVEYCWESFFRVWTAKEAVLKANGVGLAKLRACRVVGVVGSDEMTLMYEDVSWPVTHLLHEDAVVAVTARGDSVRWQVVTDGPAWSDARDGVE